MMPRRLPAFALLRLSMRTALLVSLACLTLPTVAFAQRFSAIKGQVLTDSTENPIRGAEVSIPQLRLSTLSDSAGRFRITGVTPGRQLISVKRIGFSPVTAVFDFRSGDTVDTDFLLIKPITSLKAVSVQGTKPFLGMAQFELHRANGFGRFLGPEELEKNSNRQLVEVLQLLPGPTLFRSNVSSAAWVAGGRGQQSAGNTFQLEQYDKAKGAPGGQCWAAVYLNGAPVFQGLPGEQLFDLSTLNVATIAGIEFYNGAASVPTEYNATRNTCGVLVIWLR